VTKGTPDYDRGTVDFEFSVGLRDRNVKTMQKVLNDILRELRQTNYKKNQWGFNNWPGISAESTKSNQIKTGIFEKHSVFFVLSVLLNKDGESVAMRDFFLYGQLKLKRGNNIGAASTQERQMIITVKSELITDDMQIRVISINGIDADKSNVNAYVKNYIVEKLPAKSITTIAKKDILLPEFPEEKEKRLAAEAKARVKQAEWDEKPLQKRTNLSASALYNPLLKEDWRSALTFEGGLGFGYKNFSIDGRFVTPMYSLETGGSVYGLGLTSGDSFVWEYFLLSLEGGFTYYRDNNTDNTAVLPLIEGKFDMVPGSAGFAFRIGYKMEFGSPGANEFCKSYFKENNSFGGAVRVIGNPSVGIVLWF
jgi:hypothetical protein